MLINNNITIDCWYRIDQLLLTEVVRRRRLRLTLNFTFLPPPTNRRFCWLCHRTPFEISEHCNTMRTTRTHFVQYNCCSSALLTSMPMNCKYKLDDLCLNGIPQSPVWPVQVTWHVWRHVCLLFHAGRWPHLTSSTPVTSLHYPDRLLFNNMKEKIPFGKKGS